MSEPRTLIDKLWAAHEIVRREDGAALGCTENLNPNVMVMKSAKDWASSYNSCLLDGAGDFQRQ